MNSNFFSVDFKLFRKVFLYSIVFFLGLSAVSEIFIRLSDSVSGKLESVDLTADTAGTGWILFLLFGVFLLYFLIISSLYSYLENKIWSTIYSKKTSLKSTINLFFLSILMFILILLILLGLGWILLVQLNSYPVSNILFYITALLAAYILYFSYISFTHSRKIFSSIKDAFTKSFKNMNKTYLLLIAAGILAFIFDYISVNLELLPYWVYIVLNSALLSVYAAWFKISLSKALKSVKF